MCDGVKAEAARIVIEGDEISLDPTCGAYITMNPGYLGRSELPEGKACLSKITTMTLQGNYVFAGQMICHGCVTFQDSLIVTNEMRGERSLS